MSREECARVNVRGWQGKGGRIKLQVMHEVKYLVNECTWRREGRVAMTGV